MIKYIAYKKIGNDIYFINGKSEEMKYVLIPKENITNTNNILYYWNKAKEAKMELYGKKYKIIECKKAQELINTNSEFKF